ncbi:DMT family transporter [Thiomicrorhabdus sp. zzn3]|uniref:DMT family transporter n=1 Tax=Thiomicrorhabdus sp. zzn3 TaxID=3039775 RepID=UPI002436F488|nr:DMT family transporter [Thiomicrorhabdus sp. zzn3]MDG6777311.1 DMT family transporter [Thiomicrorhabdus sp. zzn3]
METRAISALFATSILWGFSWLPLKYFHQMGFDGLSLTLFVYALMFVFIAPFLVKRRQEWQGAWKPLFGIALLGGGAQLAFNSALIYGDVIRVMVLFYLLPLWGVLGGKLFLNETIDRWRWLGMGLAISGAFLVIGGMHALIDPPTLVDLLALLAGFFFAMNNIVFRVAQEVSIRSKLGAMFLGAWVLSAVTVLVVGQPLEVNVGMEAWMALVLYALVWMMVANLGTQWAVTHLEASRSSVIIIVELVTAVLSASLILGDSMTSWEKIGAGMILISAFLEARKAK